MELGAEGVAELGVVRPEIEEPLLAAGGRSPLHEGLGRGLQGALGEVAQAGEEALDLVLRQGGAVEGALEETLELAGGRGDLGKAESGASAGQRVGQAVEGAERLAGPAGVAGGVAGRLDLGDPRRQPVGEVAPQVLGGVMLAERRHDAGLQGCRERQIVRTVSARAMGSKGLAMTSAAPISR